MPADPSAPITGMGRGYLAGPGGLLVPATDWARNTRMATGGLILARCAGQKDLRYAIAAMYLEFQNGTTAGSATAPSAPARADGIGYYQGLAADPARDFVRVPLSTFPELAPQAGDEASFPVAGTGNTMTFFAQTAATAGVLGKPFAASSESVVYGLALVATPVPADPTQDVLFARLVLGGADQLPRPAAGIVGFRYVVPL